jgi:hypothetical protein
MSGRFGKLALDGGPGSGPHKEGGSWLGKAASFITDPFGARAEENEWKDRIARRNYKAVEEELGHSPTQDGGPGSGPRKGGKRVSATKHGLTGSNLPFGIQPLQPLKKPAKPSGGERRRDMARQRAGVEALTREQDRRVNALRHSTQDGGPGSGPRKKTGAKVPELAPMLGRGKAPHRDKGGMTRQEREAHKRAGGWRPKKEDDRVTPTMQERINKLSPADQEWFFSVTEGPDKTHTKFQALRFLDKVT